MEEETVNPIVPRDEHSGRALPLDSSEGIRLVVAQNTDEVIDAWRLVYDAYVRAGLIGQNPHHLHMAPQAANASAAVMSATIRGFAVSTLTAIVDPENAEDTCHHAGRLPLDRVYGEHLDALRSEGHRLMEVGLFADRRKHLSRTAESLFQFMRLAFFYGLSQKITDFVIGVHPRHARFYMRFFGFVHEGEEKVYPAVNDHPVILLRGNLASEMAKRPLHPALAFFMDNPPEEDLFCNRFRFADEDIAGTEIEAWLNDYDAFQGLARAG